MLSIVFALLAAALLCSAAEPIIAKYPNLPGKWETFGFEVPAHFELKSISDDGTGVLDGYEVGGRPVPHPKMLFYDPHLQIHGQHWAQSDSGEDITRLLGVLDEVCRDRRIVDELRAKAESLLSATNDLSAALERYSSHRSFLAVVRFSERRHRR